LALSDDVIIDDFNQKRLASGKSRLTPQEEKTMLAYHRDREPRDLGTVMEKLFGKESIN
jgi:hypothetical protein